MEQIFLNRKINEEYQLNGFVKIPFAEKQVIQELRQLFFKYCPQSNHEGGQVFYSMFTNTPEKNLQLKHEIKILLDAAYQNVFADYFSFAEMFLAKQPGNESLVLHQDWNYVKGDELPVATVWFPLQTTTEENGTLFLLPGSHHFFRNYRSGSLPSARVPVDELFQKQLVSVDVEEGEAIVFHPSLFHGSHTNRSNQLRIVAASIILPKASEPVYFHYSKHDNKVHSYILTEKDFFENLQILTKGEIFSGAKLTENFSYAHQLITATQLSEAIEQNMKNAF